MQKKNLYFYFSELKINSAKIRALKALLSESKKLPNCFIFIQKPTVTLCTIPEYHNTYKIEPQNRFWHLSHNIQRSKLGAMAHFFIIRDGRRDWANMRSRQYVTFLDIRENFDRTILI